MIPIDIQVSRSKVKVKGHVGLQYRIKVKSSVFIFASIIFRES